MVLNLFKRDKIFEPGELIAGYQVERIMGEGQYGICYKICQEGQSYILKQLKLRMLNKAGDKLNFEEDILKNLQHNNIPCFIEKLEFKNFYGYVLEYKKGKTFDELIYDDNYSFSRDEIYRIGIQLIEILKYLHSKDIVHRDIRIPNTLYDAGKVNLVDFGLARFIDNKRYSADLDFAFLGDFLLHLYYSSFESKNSKSKPWYEELELTYKELIFLKKLMGVEKRFTSLAEVESEFYRIFS